MQQSQTPNQSRRSSHYASLHDCVEDLEQAGHLIRIREPVHPDLEIAEIQRRAYLAGAPALLFEQVVGSSFPCVSNLFGSKERARFIFRDTLAQVQAAVQMKADPAAFFQNGLREFWRQPGKYLKLPLTGIRSLPMKVAIGAAPVMANQTTVGALPQIKSWPNDGGSFITLPQVFSRAPGSRGMKQTNLGMYRIQISGNDYQPDEVGVHYQIHRTIGIHHQAALQRGERLPVAIYVGGPPAHTVAAVMPLPESLSELLFAGMLAGRRFRHSQYDGHTVAADADFCLLGSIGPETKPEGPFGDHLGYYSLTHDFPVMKVDKVFHRTGAIWPLTVVGRPPQEDTTFGELIHEITGPMVPVELPGVKGLHAVDAAGVHPLLLAVGSERYVPYQENGPQEILTQANAILGFNQCSLAKFLMIAAADSDGRPDVNDIEAFLDYCLVRLDFRRDLHFQTQTTMDTLDYSAQGLNQGSKLVLAAAGKPIRQLSRELPSDLRLPGGLGQPRVVRPGILAIQAPPFQDYRSSPAEVRGWLAQLSSEMLSGLPWVVLCDDSEFCARNLNNFLWLTFTSSNPSHDCYGVGEFTEFKHWGCAGPLVFDARQKPHMAPPLVEDPAVSKRVDELCGKGRSLHNIL